MTRDDWLRSEDPAAMLRLFTPGFAQVEGIGSHETPPRFKISDRKLRLFACAVSRLTHPKGYWEGKGAEESVIYAYAERLADGKTKGPYRPSAHCQGLDCLISNDGRHAALTTLNYNRDITPAAQADILRSIVGDPYEPVTLPTYVTGLHDHVWDIASCAYDERLPDGTLDPARMAVLSDALEEAGCDDGRILRHLRSGGPFFRGDWCLDLLTGRG